MKLYEPLTFFIIAIMVITSYGTLHWAAFEHVENHCLKHNAAVTDFGAQGPLQVCS